MVRSRHFQLLSIHAKTLKQHSRPRILELEDHCKYLSQILLAASLEEIVQEWYEINLNDKEEREFTLKNHGFLDLINHDDDFDFI